MAELKDEERTRCEIWSRVMGYYRPVKFWNAGKRQEFEDRKDFKFKNFDERRIMPNNERARVDLQLKRGVRPINAWNKTDESDP